MKPEMKEYMKELNMNEMEQVSGGNFFADLEDVLRRIFADDTKKNNPAKPEPVNGHGKC